MADARKKKAEEAAHSASEPGDKVKGECLREVDLTGNGKLIKRVLKEGSGPCPAEGSNAILNYSVSLPGGKMHIDTWEKGGAVTISVGSKKVASVCNIAVVTMKKGEVALITCSADHARGELGCEAGPANGQLTYKIELLGTKEIVSNESDDVGYLPWLVLIISALCLVLVMYTSQSQLPLPPAVTNGTTTETSAAPPVLPPLDAANGVDSAQGIDVGEIVNAPRDMDSGSGEAQSNADVKPGDNGAVEGAQEVKSEAHEAVGARVGVVERETINVPAGKVPVRQDPIGHQGKADEL